MINYTHLMRSEQNRKHIIQSIDRMGGDITGDLIESSIPALTRKG